MPDDSGVMHIAVDATVVRVLIARLEARQAARPGYPNLVALRHARICLEWLEVRDEREAKK